MSLVLLMAAVVSFVEPVVGQMRDGEIHHRTEVRHAEQIVEAQDSQAPQDRSERRPSRDHEHGTHVDHCTHQHSAALVPSLGFALLERTSELVLTEPSLHFGRPSGRLFHPPRA